MMCFEGICDIDVVGKVWNIGSNNGSSMLIVYEFFIIDTRMSSIIIFAKLF